MSSGEARCGRCSGLVLPGETGSKARALLRLQQSQRQKNDALAFQLWALFMANRKFDLENMKMRKGSMKKWVERVAIVDWEKEPGPSSEPVACTCPTDLRSTGDLHVMILETFQRILSNWQLTEPRSAYWHVDCTTNENLTLLMSALNRMDTSSYDLLKEFSQEEDANKNLLIRLTESYLEFPTGERGSPDTELLF